MDQSENFTGTTEVKERHKFDEAKLEKYLVEQIPDFQGPLKVEQFKGGQSNPTFKLTAGDRQFVMRRKPPGKILSTAHAVDREYRVISALADTDVPVAKTYCLCEDDSVIGTPFYVMDFMDGRVLWDTALPHLDKNLRMPYFEEMNKTLAALHSVDPALVGLSDYGKSGNYVARQVHRWSKQYQELDLDRIPAMDRLAEWLPENIPASEDIRIVHGDYRIDNIMFHKTEPKIIAVLDWELSTIGDPLADFSYHCMLWRLPREMFTGIGGLDFHKEGMPTEEEYVQMYCKNTGRDHIPSWDFYMAYNLFRLTAILLGIQGRVKAGTAANDNAASTSSMAEPLAELAWAQAEKAGANLSEV